MENENEAHLLTDQDLYLFNEGNHFKLYEKFGAHPAVIGGVDGTLFAVWAPTPKKCMSLGISTAGTRAMTL